VLWLRRCWTRNHLARRFPRRPALGTVHVQGLETAVHPVEVGGILGLERGHIGRLVLDAAVAVYVEEEPIVAGFAVVDRAVGE
jgi:hypothetical protein